MVQSTWSPGREGNRVRVGSGEITWKPRRSGNAASWCERTLTSQAKNKSQAYVKEPAWRDVRLFTAAMWSTRDKTHKILGNKDVIWLRTWTDTSVRKSSGCERSHKKRTAVQPSVITTSGTGSSHGMHRRSPKPTGTKYEGQRPMRVTTRGIHWSIQSERRACTTLPLPRIYRTSGRSGSSSRLW